MPELLTTPQEELLKEYSNLLASRPSNGSEEQKAQRIAMITGDRQFYFKSIGGGLPCRHCILIYRENLCGHRNPRPIAENSAMRESLISTNVLPGGHTGVTVYFDGRRELEPASVFIPAPAAPPLPPLNVWVPPVTSRPPPPPFIEKEMRNSGVGLHRSPAVRNPQYFVHNVGKNGEVSTTLVTKNFTTFTRERLGTSRRDRKIIRGITLGFVSKKALLTTSEVSRSFVDNRVHKTKVPLVFGGKSRVVREMNTFISRASKEGISHLMMLSRGLLRDYVARPRNEELQEAKPRVKQKLKYFVYGEELYRTSAFRSRLPIS